MPPVQHSLIDAQTGQKFESLELLVGAAAAGPVNSVTAGAGLVNSGTAADPVLDVNPAADGSIVVVGDAVGIGQLANDGQHGVRGGGTQHAAVTTAVNGFMSAADKVRVDAFDVQAVELAVDTTHGAPETTFTVLLTLNITTQAGSRLRIGFDATCVMNVAIAATAFFRLLVDAGVVANGGASAQLSTLSEPACIALSKLVSGLAPGVHTVDVEWRSSGLGTGLTIRPVTVPDGEHATLWAEEWPA